MVAKLRKRGKNGKTRRNLGGRGGLMVEVGSWGVKARSKEQKTIAQDH
jgi:hypothetical protein